MDINSRNQNRQSTRTIFAALAMGLACLLTLGCGKDRDASLGVKTDRSPSILGPDADQNGVRDDIDQFIASLPDTPRQKASLVQHAKALPSTLTIDPNVPSTAPMAARGVGDAVGCLFIVYDDQTAPTRSSQIQSLIANTRQRMVAYEKFNASMSGSVTKGPSGNTCAE